MRKDPVSTREPRLLSLAVAEAPHPVSQAEVAEHVGALFEGADFDVGESLAVFANAGIRRRTLALPLDAYFAGLGPELRNRHFLGVAGQMLSDAAERAVPPALRSRVTHIVTVCSSGIATPSLECGVIEDLGLAPDARRIPVFGLGCAGGVAGLAIARDLARSAPEALVLVLCVELTSLTLLTEDKSLRNFVACALFGDGAAAALVAGGDVEGRALGTLGPGRTRLFPETRALMGWDVRDRGWRVVFSPRIPGVVRRNARELVAELADGRAIRHFVLHPGGQKILDAYREALLLSEEDLAPAAMTLADYGNMSAVTVLFVLDRILRAPGFRPGPGLLTAFGPGFTAELLRVELGRGAGG